VYRYFISEAENGKPLTGLSGFKKIKGAFIYPQLIQLPISKLQSGRYVITSQLVNTENVVLAQSQKTFIKEGYRHGKTNAETMFFGSIINGDTIKMLLESLWPIAGELQKNQIINQALRNDVTLMKQYIVQFWQDRCADTADPVKSWALHYKKVQSAMALFKCGKQPAYYTDRGRVYIQYGPPNQRTQQNNEENTYPYEIWQYYRIYDAANGQFFSNRKFVFVNQMLGDDCFKLIHSDMRGETNNPRWQFEITRRNSNGLFNPDNTTPAGTENNQFRDLYNNPR
jgi:GWxTD domain-containing protein